MPTDPETRPIRWSPDRLREPFAPRQTPRAIPVAGVFDPPYRCVLVNEAWISHVVGMVDVLTEEDSWAGPAQVRYTAIQQIEAFLGALAAGNCAMGITDIRVNGCKLEVEFNDSGEWVEVGDLTACAVPGPPGAPGLDGASTELRYIDKGEGDWWVQWRQDDDDPTWADLFAVPPDGIPGPPGPDGASAELRVFEGWVQWRQDDDDPTWADLFEIPQDGAPGDPGEPGAPGQDGASAELRVLEGWVQWRQDDDDPTWEDLFLIPQEGPPGEKGDPGEPYQPPPPPAATTGAQCGATLRIIDRWSAYWDDMLNEVEAVQAYQGSIIDVISGIFDKWPILGVIVDVVTAILWDFLTWNIENLRAATGVAFWEDLTEELYCQIRVAGEMTAGILANMQAYVTGQYPAFGSKVASVIGSIAPNYWALQAYIGSQLPSVECELQWDCGIDDLMLVASSDCTGWPLSYTTVVRIAEYTWQITANGLTAGPCWIGGFKEVDGKTFKITSVTPNFQPSGCNSNDAWRRYYPACTMTRHRTGVAIIGYLIKTAAFWISGANRTITITIAAP